MDESVESNIGKEILNKLVVEVTSERQGELFIVRKVAGKKSHAIVVMPLSTPFSITLLVQHCVLVHTFLVSKVTLHCGFGSFNRHISFSFLFFCF